MPPARVVTWSAARSPACRWLGTAAKFIMPGCASGMNANGPAAAAAAAAAARCGGYGNAGGPMTDLWNSAASDMRFAGLANG